MDLPQDGQALCTNILAAMLDSSNEVWHKLVDGAFILNRAGYSLSYLHLITLTVTHTHRNTNTQLCREDRGKKTNKQKKLKKDDDIL